MNYRPSRIKVLGVYSKRFLRYRRISTPFLSGDAFASLCDVTFQPPKFQRHNPSEMEILAANSIFVKSDQLESFLTRYGSHLSARVIVCGNSDFEFHEVPKNLPDSIQLLLLQNSFISDGNRIRTLPIGIENFRWGVNGNPKFITPTSGEDSEGKILFGPFGDTHPTRLQVKNFLTSTESQKWDFVDEYIEPPLFDKLTARYAYVAAVRGNGVDTHRLWETLYRNRIPIIEESSWSRSLRNLNLPILEVSKWGEAELLNELAKLNTHALVQSQYLPELWLPYWRDLIRKY